jgi:nitrogen regulatory protein P-II 1
MKLVIAYIQPDRLGAVKEALFTRQVHKISAAHAMGCGLQKGYGDSYRGVDTETAMLNRTRHEIAVNEDFVEPTIEAILEGARTGRIGDGKIFVVDLPQCVRIRDGARGREAIG